MCLSPEHPGNSPAYDSGLGSVQQLLPLLRPSSVCQVDRLAQMIYEGNREDESEVINTLSRYMEPELIANAIVRYVKVSVLI